jgi:hypothetical protein
MVIKSDILNVFKIIYKKLKNKKINWIITGSFSFVIRGLYSRIGDIEIQTDSYGAYEIEKLFINNIIDKVKYKISENIRSHFGRLRINNIDVEIMGDIEKKINNEWVGPPNINDLKEYVNYKNMKIPVLPLEYEYNAYINLGRIEKANKIKELIRNNADNGA